MFIDLSPAIIDLSTFNNGIPFMFSVDNCDNLTTINLSGINTSNTFDILMVLGCNQLSQINWPACNATDILIQDCQLIPSIVLPAGIKIVGPSSILFQNNISLTALDVQMQHLLVGVICWLVTIRT